MSLVLLAGGLLLWRLGANGTTSSRERDAHERAVAMMERLAPRPGQLFVLWGDHFPYEDLVYPLESLSIPRDFEAGALGWGTTTPLTTRRLRAFGISDLYRALYERRDVFLLSDEEKNVLLARYLAQHYRVRLGGRAVFGHPALGPSRFYTLADLGRLSPRPKQPSRR